jgi:hypothetical protein
MQNAYYSHVKSVAVKVPLFVGPNFVISTKCVDPWDFEFVVSNITDNNQWENCTSFDFYFRGLSGQRNQWKLEPQD